MVIIQCEKMGKIMSTSRCAKLIKLSYSDQLISVIWYNKFVNRTNFYGYRDLVSNIVVRIFKPLQRKIQLIKFLVSHLNFPNSIRQPFLGRFNEIGKSSLFKLQHFGKKRLNLKIVFTYYGILNFRFVALNQYTEQFANKVIYFCKPKFDFISFPFLTCALVCLATSEPPAPTLNGSSVQNLHLLSGHPQRKVNND